MVNRCLIQTDARAGSSAWCTAVSRRAWTVSGSAASAEAGLIKSEMHRLAGIARRTLDRIPGTGGGDRP
jgi:hypothetical protein